MKHSHVDGTWVCAFPGPDFAGQTAALSLWVKGLVTEEWRTSYSLRRVGLDCVMPSTTTSKPYIDGIVNGEQLGVITRNRRRSRLFGWGGWGWGVKWCRDLFRYQLTCAQTSIANADQSCARGGRAHGDSPGPWALAWTWNFRCVFDHSRTDSIASLSFRNPESPSSGPPARDHLNKRYAAKFILSMLPHPRNSILTSRILQELLVPDDKAFMAMWIFNMWNINSQISNDMSCIRESSSKNVLLARVCRADRHHWGPIWNDGSGSGISKVLLYWFWYFICFYFPAGFNYNFDHVWDLSRTHTLQLCRKHFTAVPDSLPRVRQCCGNSPKF